MLQKVEASNLYRNKKTGVPYKVISLGTHTETKEPMVVYQNSSLEGSVWVRPLDLFKQKFEGPV
jgi:hypothetical protein